MAELYDYGVSQTIYFPLIDYGTTDYLTSAPTIVAADCQISKDGAAFGNTTNAFTFLGNGIGQVVLTATEMQAHTILITVIDSATKEWEDQSLLIHTFGNASAKYAVDFDDAVRMGLTSLPNAAAEAAGGLYTRGTGAGQINQAANGQVDTNLVALEGTAQSATDLKDFADAGYDPGTKKVQGVVLVDTTTTNTDMITAATVKTQCDTALTDIDLDHWTFNATAMPTVTAGTYLDLLQGATFATGTDSLEAIRTNGGDGPWTTATGFNTDATSVIVDAVWNELLAGHTTPDSAGKTLSDVLVDTNELQTDDVPGLIAALQDLSTTDVAAAVWNQDATTYQNSGTFGLQLGDPVDDGEVANSSLAWHVWREVLTGATHNVANSAGRRLRELLENGTYEDGAIWISVNGTVGDTPYENGTTLFPVTNITDANTLNSSLSLDKYRVSPATTIQLLASEQNQVFEGENWVLDLNGQNISGSVFKGATVSGIGTSTTGSAYFIDCEMGACTLPNDTHVVNCSLTGTQTLGAAGDYFFENCHSAVAGSGSVTIDFGSGLNASNLNVRHHSGGWTVENMGAGTGTYNASFEGEGQIVWAATCSATSSASVRGAWKITDNASGAVTVTLDDTTQDAVDILVDTADMQPKLGTITSLGSGATIGDNLQDMAFDGIATYDRTTDSLQAIADGGGGSLTAAQVWDYDVSLTTAGATKAGVILHDWADGERLDLLLDGVSADTDTIITNIGNLQDISAADVNAQCDLALSDIFLDQLLANAYNSATPPGNPAALLNEMTENDAGETRFTINALENAPSGTGATPQQIWDFAITGTAPGVDLAGNVLGAVRDDLANGTDGLGALKALIDAIQVDIGTPLTLGSGATLSANLQDIAGGGFSSGTHSLSAIGGACACMEPVATGTCSTNGAPGQNEIGLNGAGTAVGTTNYYIGMVLEIDGGTGVGQSRFITSYDNSGNNKVAEVCPEWAFKPDGTSTFKIWPISSVPISSAWDANSMEEAIFRHQITTAYNDSESFGHLVGILTGKAAAGNLEWTSGSGEITVGSVFDLLASKTNGGTYDPVTDSLEAISDGAGGGGGATAQEIWDFDVTTTALGADRAGNVLISANQRALLDILFEGAYYSDSWNFDPSTITGDPGISDVRFNNATLSNVTEMYFDVGTTDNSANNFFSRIADNDIIKVFNADRSCAYTYRVNGAPTNNVGWWTIIVDGDAGLGSSLPATGERVYFGFFSETAEGLTAGDVWEELQASHVTANTFGVIATEIADILTDTADMQPKFGAVNSLGTGATLFDNMQDLGGSSFNFITDSQENIYNTLDSLNTTVNNLNDITALDVWNVQTSTITTLNSIGIFLKNLNDISVTDVKVEADKALVDIGLNHLISTSVANTDVADDSIIAKMVSKAATADFDTFSNLSDSLEAIRDNLSAGSGLTPVATGTAQSVTATTIQLADAETFADDELNGSIVHITSATLGTGQSRVITDYDGGTDTATVYPAWTTTPTAPINYEITPGSINVATFSLSGEAADNLEESAQTIIPCVVETDAPHTPTTTEFQSSTVDASVAAADHFNGRVIIFTSGTLKDQATKIVDYEKVGSYGQFTVIQLTSAPADGDTFIII